MREPEKLYPMPIFPLFVIGGTMLAMLLYLLSTLSSSPVQHEGRVYVPLAYGVSETSLSAEGPPQANIEFIHRTPLVLSRR